MYQHITVPPAGQKITVNADNRFAGAAAPNSYSLDGAGLSLAWRGSNAVIRPTLVATWARRLGSHPSPGSSGQDQDGSLDRDRLWLLGSLQF